MTTTTWPTRFTVFLVMAMLVITFSACGGGGTGPTPVPSPTPLPAPVREVLRPAVPFTVYPEILGYAASNPTIRVPGTLDFTASWTPTPAEGGQVYLFIIKNPEDKTTCFWTYATCPEVLARNISSEHPKRVTYHVLPGQNFYVWVRGIEGRTTGLLEVGLTPDS